MALTITQRQALAAHIRASVDTDVIAALAVRNDVELARLYNLDSTFVVWKTAVLPVEYKSVIDWTEVDTLTNGSARIWEWVSTNMQDPLDASDVNVRQGIADAWSGKSTLTALIGIAKRFATVAESIFTTGTGTTATPGGLVYEGAVSFYDIGQALNENP